MEYGLLERANLLWKVLEQMFSSSNDQRSSSKTPKNISSSSLDINQEEQSSVQKEETESISLGKLDGPISQTGVSGFGRMKISLAEEDDCYTSSSDIDDDDDDTDDEYDCKELLLKFKTLISKHMKLQKRYGDLLCSHKDIMDSYACDEHVHVETCDSLIASENDELKRENKMLKMEFSRLKGKGNVQQSQDNHDHMVKKLEKGSIITCGKLAQINLKTSYQKIDKTNIRKKAHVKCFECSTLGHFSSECPNKKIDQAKLSRRQRSLSQRRCFSCIEESHNIAACPNEKASKQVCQNWSIQF
jgi:hypothetical protein